MSDEQKPYVPASRPARADGQGGGARHRAGGGDGRGQRLPGAEGGADGVGDVPGRDPGAGRLPAAVLPGQRARAEHRPRRPGPWARRWPRAPSSPSRRSCWCRSTGSGCGPSFDYWQTSLILLIGGILGVLFITLLRRTLVVDADLPFPESRACAAIVKAGQAGRDRRQVRVRRDGPRHADPDLQGQRRAASCSASRSSSSASCRPR